MSLTVEQQRIADAFPEISWSESNHVCIYRPEGVLTGGRIARMLAWLGEVETDNEQPFTRFTDLTKVEAFEVSRLDLANVAFWRRATYVGPVVKSAFLAHSKEGLELANTYRSFMEGSQIVVSVFDNLKKAATWLGVPAKTLREGKAS